MIEKLEAIKDRFMRLEEQLSDPEVIADNKRYSKIHKEYKELSDIVSKSDEYRTVLDHIRSACEIIRTERDPDLIAMAREEIDTLEAEQEILEEALKLMLIPKDPEDEKDVIFEIRRELAATKPPSLPVTSTGCTRATLKCRDGMWKLYP